LRWWSWRPAATQMYRAPALIGEWAGAVPNPIPTTPSRRCRACTIWAVVLRRGYCSGQFRCRRHAPLIIHGLSSIFHLKHRQEIAVLTSAAYINCFAVPSKLSGRCAHHAELEACFLLLIFGLLI
jgi:hypothetical protein